MTSDRGTSGESELQLDTPNQRENTDRDNTDRDNTDQDASPEPQNTDVKTATEVTPKSPGLNPNATVFLSCKSGPGAPDTGQWEQQQQQQQQQQQGHSDSGIYLSSSSDYSFANGDVSVDKTDAAVFSPTSESTFQPEFSPQYTDNQAFPSDSNANIAAKLEDTIARHLSDDQDPLPGDAPPPAMTLPDVSVPMTGENYSSDNSANASDGEAPAGDISVPESQLRLAIKNQLETYFSRENLSGDSYLQSQMDSDQYVPIATVASLDNIQRLTSDLRLIVELLRESTFVQVDEKGEKVRPNHNRCIVILREIPDTTPVEEVQGLFSGQNCPQFVSCEFAHNSNWYVTFESDADAHRAYLYLREDVKTFLGKPIMARIKAKPLIRAYTPKNGYMNKRYQPMMPQPSAPPLQEVPTSTAPQPQTQQQFSTTQPFALMPNVSQYHLNGQQAMPFYPPPNPLLQNWNSNTMLDPSMVGTVLALNGYQPTSVKVNPVANRAPYPANINRNNIRNQNLKLHSRPMNQDRMPEPLPPRLSHQREQQQQQQMQQQQMQQQQQHSCNANMHKTSPRNAETTPISNHPSMYQTRRLENLNHPTHPPMPHSMQPHSHPPPHPPPPPPHVHQPLSQHVDNNANNNVLLSSRPPPPTDQLPLSQRYAGKSYKSRRRRDEDGARPPRPNSQTSPSIPEQRPYDKQFDYEPTNFPPLPGACNNATSGDVFENKLSDVVRGTAKPQVRDTPKAVTTATPSSTATTTSSSAPPSAIPATPHTTSKENKENIATSNHANVPVQQTSTPIPSQQTIPSSSGVTTSCQPSVSPVVKATEKPVQSIASELPAPKPVVVHTQSKILEEKPVASQVKLSYAQMVQRSRAAEGGADTGEGSDSDPETLLQHSNIANSIAADPALPTQSNSKSTSAISRSPAKEAFRKDRDFGTEEPREQPREQRVNNARRMKENRERRFDNRDTRDMRDRRVDRGGFERRDREREVPRTAVAK